MSKSTILAEGQINHSPLTVELSKPFPDTPATVHITWPSSPTVVTPAKFPETAAAAMKLLAEASTTLAATTR